jgi:O-antigen/teichoic acid export membrane protein
MKNIIDKIISKIYWLIYKENPSENVKIFIDNLYYVIIGFGLAALLSFIFQVLSGRILGPEEYGKYTIVQSIAMFIFIPMNLGISTAMIKYNAESEDFERQKKIISASYIITLIFSIFFSFLYFFYSQFFSKILNISVDTFNFSIIFALLFNLYTLSTSVLRSLHKMKRLSFVQAIYGLLAVVLSLVFLYSLSFKIIVIISYISYIFVFLLITFSIYKYLIFELDKFWVEKLFRYSFYVIIGSVASAFYLNFNKIIINKYLTLTDVGIFGAYFTCFITLPNFLFSIFNTVFFPSASKYRDKNKIFTKLNKIVFILAITGFPAIASIGFLLLKLYGSKYYLNFSLGLMFACASLLVLIDGLYGWLMSSVGKTGAKISSISAVVLAAISIILSILLIPSMGLEGAVISMIFSYCTSIGVLLMNKKIILSIPSEYDRSK